MFYHAETNQYFSSKLQAQNSLKVLSPDLQEVTVVDPGTPDYNQDTQRVIRNQTLSGATRTISYTIENLTQAEIAAKVDDEVNKAAGVSDVDKAIGFLMADLWLYASTGKLPNQSTAREVQTARQQVRNRLETHLRAIKGL